MIDMGFPIKQQRMNVNDEGIPIFHVILNHRNLYPIAQ